MQMNLSLRSLDIPFINTDWLMDEFNEETLTILSFRINAIFSRDVIGLLFTSGSADGTVLRQASQMNFTPL